MTRWFPAPEIDWGIDNPLLFLDGIGDARIDILRQLGVETLDDIIAIDPEKINAVEPSIKIEMVRRWKICARAIKARRIEMDAPPPPPDGMVFVDLEMGGPGTQIIWLIGVYDADRDVFKHFLAKRDFSERGMLRYFIDYLENEVEGTIFTSYSGNNMDYNLLRKRIEHHGLKSPRLEAMQKYDLMHDLKYRIWLRGYFPNYKLKTIGRLVGYRWKHSTEIDGRTVAYLWNSYQKNPERRIPWGKFIDYNRDDVLSMHHIILRLRELWSRAEELNGSE